MRDRQRAEDRPLERADGDAERGNAGSRRRAGPRRPAGRCHHQRDGQCEHRDADPAHGAAVRSVAPVRRNDEVEQACSATRSASSQALHADDEVERCRCRETPRGRSASAMSVRAPATSTKSAHGSTQHRFAGAVDGARQRGGVPRAARRAAMCALARASLRAARARHRARRSTGRRRWPRATSAPTRSRSGHCANRSSASGSTSQAPSEVARDRGAGASAAAHGSGRERIGIVPRIARDAHPTIAADPSASAAKGALPARPAAAALARPGAGDGRLDRLLRQGDHRQAGLSLRRRCGHADRVPHAVRAAAVRRCWRGGRGAARRR